MNLRLAIIISLFAGFVSISMEIMWFSIIGYMFKGHAFTFGIVLALILYGIAIGAKRGYRAIQKPGRNVPKLIADILLYAGIINFVAFPLIGWLMTIHSVFGVLLVFAVVGISGMIGCIFPLLCHVAVSADEHKVGKQTSLLYGANIIGATTGPLITGYILLDYFETHIIITGLCVILILLSLVLRIYSFSFRASAKNVGIGAAVIVASLLINGLLYNHFYEHIHYQADFNEGKVYKHMFHSKGGIIAVDQEGRVYGSGTYDGAMNIDPLKGVNVVERAYMVAAFHPNPEKVLMIGLSSGSWAKIVSDYGKVKELTIIEINPDYLNLINKYPEIASFLKEKKVKIVIDDGRRWLKHNADRKFDMIIMNTTFHWRQNSTNLLSVDFLKMCKNSLNKNGVVYWNPTRSPDIFYTAAHVFDHITNSGGFVVASDSPFDLTYEQKLANFHEFRRDGKPLHETPIYGEKMGIWANLPLPEVQDSVLKQNLFLITDNNMACEFKTDIWHLLMDEKTKKTGK